MSESTNLSSLDESTNISSLDIVYYSYLKYSISFKLHFFPFIKTKH